MRTSNQLLYNALGRVTINHFSHKVFFVYSLFSEPHNCSLGFYVGEVRASWKMTKLRIELTKPARVCNAQPLNQVHAHFRTNFFFLLSHIIAA